MKKLLTAAAAAAGLLGAGLFLAPADAYNQTNCSYATWNISPDGGATQVGVQAGPNGMPGDADAEFGACLNTAVFGGAAGVGVGTPLVDTDHLDGPEGHTGCVAGVSGLPAGAYGIADGDAGNPAVTEDPDDGGPIPTVNVGTSGYIGVSTYENGATEAPPFSGTGTGTNSGCNGVGIDPGVPEVGGTLVPGVPVACGFTSGTAWNGTGRDGCYFP